MASRAASTFASIQHRQRSPFRPLPTASILHRRAPLRSTRRHAAIREASETAPFLRVMRRTHREMKQLIRVSTEIRTSNHRFNEMLRRSTVDLAMLLTETPQGLYPYAGIPWYSTTFGRDGLITALQCLWLDRRIPLAVLRRLAAMQADRFDAASDAAPGKILHETRAGEMARLNEIPFGLYYGSVDSTPLFVLLAGQYAQTSGDLETLKELWPAMQRALDWIDGPGDPDQDGFVEYFRHSEKGLVNQGWKDSHDADLSCRWTDWREGRSRSPRCKAMSMRPRRLQRKCAEQLGLADRARELREQADRLADAFRTVLLVRGARHLRNGARWREEPLPGAQLQCRPGAVQRHRAAGSCRSASRPG